MDYKSNDSYLYNRKAGGIQHMEEKPRKTQRQRVELHSPKAREPAANRARRGKTDFLLKLQRQHSPADTLTLDFWQSEL